MPHDAMNGSVPCPRIPAAIPFDGPPVVLGCSPFVAARQFGERCAGYEARFRGRPDRVRELWSAFVAAGGRAIHLVDDEELWRAYEEWPARGAVEAWLTVAGDAVEAWCRRAADCGVNRVFRHATQVDGGERLDRFVGAARACGLAPGAATHRPGWATRAAGGPPPVDPALPLLVPFNPSGYAMDEAPRPLHARLASRPGAAVAMIPLAAGRTSFSNGVSFAALHFGVQIVGTGDVAHARALVETATRLPLLRAGRRFRRVANPSCDVSVGDDEVLLLRDHSGLRLGAAAARLFRRMEEPADLAELVMWAVRDGAPDAVALPSVAGVLLSLLGWAVVEVETEA